MITMSSYILRSLLFLGGPIIVTYFSLPERFQLVYSLSGLDAGVRLIPFALIVPFGTGVATAVARRFRIPAIFILLIGSCLQVTGFALLGTLPRSIDIPHQIYGFEILAGFGCGMNFTPLFLIIPQTVDPRDKGKLVNPKLNTRKLTTPSCRNGRWEPISHGRKCYRHCHFNIHP